MHGLYFKMMSYLHSNAEHTAILPVKLTSEWHIFGLCIHNSTQQPRQVANSALYLGIKQRLIRGENSSLFVYTAQESCIAVVTADIHKDNFGGFCMYFSLTVL